MFDKVMDRVDELKYSKHFETYLYGLLKRDKLLRDGTKIAIYENLAQRYREQGDEKSEVQVRSKLGELCEKVAAKLEEEGRFDIASYKYEEACRAYYFPAMFGDNEDKEKFRYKMNEMYKSQQRTRRENRNSHKGLEKSLIVFVSLAFGLFFLSPAVTGNAIANLSGQISNTIGICLFIIGIVCAYFFQGKFKPTI